jgi:hypothetical protein
VSRRWSIGWSRIASAAALCLCLVEIACGQGAVVSSAGVATRLFVSPTGSDLGPCSQSNPCATFDRAYHAAAQGQTVQVLPGDYTAQAIRSDASKTGSAKVVFDGVDAARARIAGVRVAGNHIELRRLTAPWAVMPGTTDVVFRRVISPGPISIAGASRVSVLGGEVYSPTPVANDSLIASSAGKIPTDILIDGVSFHDFRDVGPGQFHHIECLQVGAGINLTIRNSTFHDCATHDLFIRSWGVSAENPSPLSNVVIENNWFARTDGFYAVQVLDDLFTGTPASSVILRNNSSLQGFVVRISHGKASVHGNILPSMSEFVCEAYGQNQWLDYNVYASGVPCGPHDRVGDPKFVDAARFDLRLQAGSSALGRGDLSSHPAFDIEGKLRPMRKAPDAGASQRETAEININESIGAATLGSTKLQLDSFYGSPRRTVRFRKHSGTTIATYRVHGGALWVLYRNGAVIGIGTTSRYYSTLSGLGVGLPTKRFASLKLRWGACRGAYRRTTRTSALYVTRGHSAKVTSLWVLRPGLGACPQLPG